MLRSALIAACCIAFAGPAFAGGPVTPYTNDRIGTTGSGLDQVGICKSRSFPVESRLRNCRAVIGVGHGRDFDAMVEVTIGSIYNGTGKFDLALAPLDQAIAWEPDYAGAFNERCWAKAMIGTDLEGARADCDRALKLVPDQAMFLDSAGLVEFKAGKLDDAAARYDAALKADAKFASALFMRGIIKRRQGSTADGDTDIAAAEKLDEHVAREYAGYGIAP